LDGRDYLKGGGLLVSGEVGAHVVRHDSPDDIEASALSTRGYREPSRVGLLTWRDHQMDVIGRIIDPVVRSGRTNGGPKHGR
jgi:hypothetical protein